MVLLPFLTAEVLEEVLTVAGSLLLPVLGRSLGLQPIFDAFLALKKRQEPPSSTADLLKRLHMASSEMDSVLAEFRAAADERRRTVATLEGSINELIAKKKTLQHKIQGTEGISVATANTLAQKVEDILQKAERPKKRRDYILFAAGVIVSAAVGIGIEVTKPIWERVLHVQVESAPTPANNNHEAPPSR